MGLRRLTGTIALVLGAVALAAALHDPGVRDFVADRVTDLIISQQPNLIAVRPLVLTAVAGLVGTRPFEGLVRTAADRAHELAFSEGAERVVIALPDVGVLVRDVLARADPGLSARIPTRVQQSLATPVRTSTISSCNGAAVLCDKRVDEVVFPGAHNAMSNQDIPGWMFPHHQAGLVPTRGAAGSTSATASANWGPTR